MTICNDICDYIKTNNTLALRILVIHTIYVVYFVLVIEALIVICLSFKNNDMDNVLLNFAVWLPNVTLFLHLLFLLSYSGLRACLNFNNCTSLSFCCDWWKFLYPNEINNDENSSFKRALVLSDGSSLAWILVFVSLYFTHTHTFEFLQGLGLPSAILAMISNLLCFRKTYIIYQNVNNNNSLENASNLAGRKSDDMSDGEEEGNGTAPSFPSNKHEYKKVKTIVV